MKILVYGAGNIGRLYAARLQDGGQEVTILARGRRLEEIREHGIPLKEFGSGRQTTTRVDVVDRLGVGDGYDLVLVVLARNHVAEVLPILAANRQTPNVMFFGNNAAGAAAMIEALGRQRVLLGFPGAAAVADGHGLRYIILSKGEQPTTIGELDGAKSERIVAIGEALRSAGFPVSICPDMDAWLKTHVAEISPTANALYVVGGDPGRLAGRRDVLVMMLRAIREGHEVLSALGIPITPRSHRVFDWLPEPLLLFVMRRRIESEAMSLKIGHVLEARSEMKVLAEEFADLARQAGMATPSIDALTGHIGEVTERPSVATG